MKLTHHEQQLLDEIEQGVQAQDPDFFASMAGAQSRRGGSAWGSAMLAIGLVAFVFAAIIAQVMPEVGFAISVGAFMIMFWGLSLLSHWAFDEQDQCAVRRRRVGRLWDSLPDPPPPGASP